MTQLSTQINGAGNIVRVVDFALFQSKKIGTELADCSKSSLEYKIVDKSYLFSKQFLTFGTIITGISIWKYGVY